MRRINRVTCGLLLGCCLVALFGVTVPLQARVAGESSAPTELPTLRKAYAALKAADHDYHGHRIKAMKAIEAACKALDATVEGDGKGDEPQAESDTHLRKAKDLLESINPTATGRHTKAATHITHAISELNTALSIK